MQIVFLGPKQLRFGFVWIIGLVFLTGFILNWDRLARQMFGVKPGVRLEGYLVGGMLPEEVTEIVRSMAAKIDREPKNAGYFLETGELITAVPGRQVDISRNVSQVCLAQPNSNLKLLISQVEPSVTDDLFQPIYHGNTGRSAVALAINVAWGEEYLDSILKTLADAKVKVTFFFVGTWVKAFPEEVRTIAAAGHEIANHGSYHGHPTQMGKEELKKLVLENQTLLAATIGRKVPRLFAPPYGEMNSLVVNVAAELGFRTILWSVDSIDWKNPTPEVLLDRVLSKIEPGGIILLHPTIATKEALPRLIKGLQQKGLQPGTISMVLQK